MAPSAESDNKVIPKGYFCKWDLKLFPEYDWSLKIYRYQSLLPTEIIDIIMKSSIATLFTDDVFRSRSYRNSGNYTSRFL